MIYFIGGWVLSVILGLWIKSVNHDVIFVSDVLYASLFGPIYLLAHICDLDVVVWKRRK